MTQSQVELTERDSLSPQDYRYWYTALVDEIITGDQLFLEFSLGFSITYITKVKLANVELPFPRDKETSDRSKKHLENLIPLDSKVMAHITMLHQSYFATIFRYGESSSINSLMLRSHSLILV